MHKYIVNDLKVFAKHLNLLIVEDELELCQELVDFFECFFKNIKWASNGLEALELYKKNRFDIVITDLNMPKMDGVQLSREIRTLNREQVIIVLSGHIDTYVIDLIDIGIQALIIKPYELESFLQKILVQCENVVLRKAFNKMKLSKLSQNESINNNSKLLVVNSIAKELVDSKRNKHLEIEENKQIDEKIDDTMWIHVKEDILELNYEYEDVINLILLNGFSKTHQSNLVRIFNKYYSSLLMLSNLNDLAKVFSDLRDLIDALDLSTLESKDIEVFNILEFFYEDIINFFNIIFIDKETKNINYLTDSLKSSVEQMKCNLGLSTLSEDELEFF
jgi:YesN/AraC family two-component response regulator